MPNQRSKVLPATRTPSRVEYTPKASSVSPATAEPSFALSASSSLTPLPMWPNVALMASSSFFRSSSSVSSRVLSGPSAPQHENLKPGIPSMVRSDCGHKIMLQVHIQGLVCTLQHEDTHVCV